MTDCKIEVLYFNGPGRAELVRLALAAGKNEFTDTRVEQKDWPELKSDPDGKPAKFFGSMPILTVNGVDTAQSQACSLYAAELGIDKDRTPAQRAKIVMVSNTHADLQAAMYKGMFGDDDSKAAGMKALPDTVARLCGGLERLYPESGFLLGGESPSLADLAVFDNFTSVFPGLKAMGQDLSKFPKLAAVVKAVGEFPPVSAYVAKRGF